MLMRINTEIKPSKDKPYSELVVRHSSIARFMEYVRRMARRVFSLRCAPGLYFFVDDQGD